MEANIGTILMVVNGDVVIRMLKPTLFIMTNTTKKKII